MKNSILKPIPLLLLSFACCLLTIGCSSAKRIREESTTVKTQDQQKDSITTTIINQPINDRLITPIVQSNTGNPVLDSLVDAKVDEILSKLNTAKNSGANSYQLIYDAMAKQLEFNARIAQTKNENTAVTSEKTITTAIEKKIPIVVKKPLSKIEIGLMLFGILALVFIGFKIVGFIRKKTILWH